MRKKQKMQEWLTGLAIGLILSLLFAIKVFAAPVSVEEADLIARTVQAEAGNQGFEGKRLVAAVVLNRVDSEIFPNDVEGVLSQDGQFATYKRLSRTKTTWQDNLAVRMEIEQRSNNEVLFFRTNHYGTGKPLMKVEDHYFSTIK